MSPFHRHPRAFRTVLDAVISDLVGIAESTGCKDVEWLTITPYGLRVGTPRQTLIGRISAWYDHYSRLSKEPWNDPLSCPIYRVGRMPRTPRRGHQPGCWLLDIRREREILTRLRNFSNLSRAEQRRLNRLAGDSKHHKSIDIDFATWSLQHQVN